MGRYTQLPNAERFALTLDNVQLNNNIHNQSSDRNFGQKQV